MLSGGQGRGLWRPSLSARSTRRACSMMNARPGPVGALQASGQDPVLLPPVHAPSAIVGWFALDHLEEKGAVEVFL